MPSKFTVLYDACVLYPAPLRDLLMRLALTDLFRAKWSNMIHEEWIHNALKNRPDLNRENLERTRDLMNQNVRDCLVNNFEHLIPAIDIPDQNDRHIVAAAIKSGTDAIITFNLKDFPNTLLEKYNIYAEHPDDFISNLLELNPPVVCSAIAKQRASLKNPPYSADDLLKVLLKQGLTQTVEILTEWRSLL